MSIPQQQLVNNTIFEDICFDRLWMCGIHNPIDIKVPLIITLN